MSRGKQPITDQPNGRINVSEDKLRAILAEFKLSLLDELKEYASIVAFNALEARVKTLELWQAGVVGSTSTRRQISLGALAWAALAVSALTALATVIWLSH